MVGLTVGGMLEGWRRDLAHAGRALRRTLGFTVVTVGTLALAIGATAGEDPIGRRLRPEQREAGWQTVVGVVDAS